jgi:hypothetical protein
MANESAFTIIEEREGKEEKEREVVQHIEASCPQPTSHRERP